jgi:hypothetical protein
MEICTSHFKEDLGWLDKSPWPVSIVHHEGGDPVEYTYSIPNRGFEVTSYLKYIIERYDTLPDHVAFIHGHEEAWHQQGDRPLLEMIRTANIEKYNYVPLNNSWRCVTSKLQMHSENEFSDKYGIPPAPENFITCCGGQFIVSKNAILRHPRGLYEYFYDIVEDKASAIYFELLWHAIFLCGDSIIPREDYFNPPLKEVLYHTSCNIPILIRDFKLCFVGKNSFPGMIHIKTQEEYNYYQIRGATFFVHEHEDIEVDFIIDLNKLFFVHNVALVFKSMKIFDDITRILSNY